MKLKHKPFKNNPDKIDPKGIQFKYLNSIEKPLEEQGVVFFDENYLNVAQEYLVLPQEITEVPSRELGQYLNAFTQQKIYLRTLLGRIDLMLEQARRDYYAVSHSLYKEYSGTKMSETTKDRLINEDESVKETYFALCDLKQKHNLIELNIENIEDAVFMLSREVTRRTGDFNDENRNHNVSRR